VERTATFVTAEKPTRLVCAREAEDVGAPATLDSFAPHKWERQNDSKRLMLDTWIIRKLARILLKTSAIEEGAVVHDGEWSP
jgi:hypothetical protein